MDLEHGNGSNKNLKHVEFTNNEVDPRNRIIFPSTCSIENSQELFVIDMDDLNPIGKPKQDVPEVAGQSPAEILHEGSSSSVAQPRGYDPNRIPVSVFGTKPANGTEWSVTSNDSLFSLHLGTGSFSREHFLTLYKSGELGKLEDSMKPVKPDESIPISKPVDARNHFQPSLPTVTEGENLDKMYMAKDSNVEDTPKVAIIETVENQSSPPAAENVHVARRSQGRVNSSKSSAFPVLEDREEYTTKSIKMNIWKTDSEKKSSRNEQPREKHIRAKQQQQLSQKSKTTIREAGSIRFSCFLCFSMCQSARN